MRTYLGNGALSSAVKERVLSTFQQAVALYKQGRTEEVIQGCALILQMDPMFDPAKKLQEKARNPSAAIDIDKLIPASPPDRRLLDARTAMAGRDFQKVVDLTTDLLTEDLTNDDARILNEQAREKTEALPFVDQFIRKAETFMGQGNNAAARGELDKARALDGDHPGIRRVEQAMSAAGAASPPMSFVVDAPASPAGRGTAQAADFGFTFEEDKQAKAPSQPSPFSTETGTVPPVTPPRDFPSGEQPKPPASGQFGSFSFDTPSNASGFASFSFDAPSSPKPQSGGSDFGGAVKAPASAEFDFSTASTVTTPDDQKKIQQYLSDGDRAFDAGEYQQAIDLWSRIFLIDVTNDEASQRIEKAKVWRHKIEQQVENVVAAGVLAFERKDTETARAKFNEVLRADPNNATARDYLKRLSGSLTEGEAAPFETPVIPPTPASQQRDIFADDPVMSGSYEPPAPELAPAPRRGPAAAKVAPAPARAKAKQPMPMGVIGTIAGVVVLAAIGWFAWSKFVSRPARDPGATQAIFTQASSLAQRGKLDQAIAALQDVKPNDPQHDKALQMIADLQQKKSQASEMVSGRPASVVYQEGLANGKTAFEAHDYDAAKKAFDSAAQIKPLPHDMQVLYDQASQQVGKLASAKSLFREGRFQDALTNLEQIAQSDPQNTSVRRMITDAHFNMGAQAMQNEHLPEAIQAFDEVLKIEPNDELSRRSRTLAERYNGQPKDLLFRMYVKYLPMRGVN